MADRLQDLLRLAAVTKSPHSLTRAGRAERWRDPHRCIPAPGQVWRARWEGDSLLLLLLAGGPQGFTAAPVTVEPTGEDAEALVVGPAMTAFSVDVTLWCGLRQAIAQHVLDEVIDSWPPEIVGYAYQGPGAGQPVPGGCRPGEDQAEDTEFRGETAAAMQRLAAAPSLPVHQGNDPPGDLHRTLGLKLADVMKALNVTQALAMDVLRGDQPLSPPQIATLSRRSGIPVADIEHRMPALPAGLVEAVEAPRWRAEVAALARRNDVDEYEARNRAAFGAYALAARSGPSTKDTDVDWDQRLRRWFQAGADHEPEERGR